MFLHTEFPYTLAATSALSLALHLKKTDYAVVNTRPQRKFKLFSANNINAQQHYYEPRQYVSGKTCVHATAEA
jgi:hypothetical protein